MPERRGRVARSVPRVWDRACAGIRRVLERYYSCWKNAVIGSRRQRTIPGEGEGVVEAKCVIVTYQEILRAKLALIVTSPATITFRDRHELPILLWPLRCSGVAGFSFGGLGFSVTFGQERWCGQSLSQTDLSAQVELVLATVLYVW